MNQPGLRKRLVRIAAIAFFGYVGLVVTFEFVFGYFQPENPATLVMTTFEADGTPHDRVLERYETDGQLYVSASHWPRAWYRRALDNPEVQVVLKGATGDYLAIPVSGDEHERVVEAYPAFVVFRILAGFPPRRVVRLDPR
jgi:hypothetical protein